MILKIIPALHEHDLDLRPMSTTASPDLRVKISTREILKIALPISAAMAIPNVNFITNNIFLGGLGEKELAVAGITGVYYLIFALVGLGLNNGLQSLISRRAGENRLNEIGKLFINGIYVSVAIALLGIIITYTATPYIFRYALHSEENVEMAVRFLNIRIWGLVFLYIYQMRNALLVGISQTKLLFIAALAETITNIFFDYVLIYGRFGFPKLGFDGAAYASIIAEFIGMMILFAVIHRKGIGRQFSLFKDLRFSKAHFLQIFTVSSPLMLQFAVSLVSWEFFYILIEHHGDEQLAISNAMRNVFGFFGCFSWAFAAASNAMVSNVIGQGLQDQVPLLISRIMKLSVGFSLMVCVIINIAPREFLAIYGQDEHFIEHGIPVLRIISFALVFMAVSVVWLNAVTGTGSTRITLAIEIFAIIFYCIYVYLVLEKFRLPIAYGWMSEWLYWTCLFVPSFVFIRGGKWRNRKI
jgi:putative MATE family efflux protein